MPCKRIRCSRTSSVSPSITLLTPVTASAVTGTGAKRGAAMRAKWASVVRSYVYSGIIVGMWHNDILGSSPAHTGPWARSWLAAFAARFPDIRCKCSMSMMSNVGNADKPVTFCTFAFQELLSVQLQLDLASDQFAKLLALPNV